MTTLDLASLREDYKQQSLNETDLLTDPMAQFEHWFKQAVSSKVPEPNAMTLATVSADGQPTARIVLLKGLESGGFSFFTNYNSQKGQDLAREPRAALVFCWLELERQVRIEGVVKKVSAAESDKYFAVRPALSRLGAWASAQSSVIESRQVLEQSMAQFQAQYGNNAPRPEHWGGYLLIPNKMEFWQGRRSRLHDRLRYTRDSEQWRVDRLAP
jgi:pyridoxamine 5'-phosphate oxidase